MLGRFYLGGGGGFIKTGLVGESFRIGLKQRICLQCGAKTYVGPLEVLKEMEKSPKCIDTHSIIRVLGSYPFHSSYWNYLEPEQPL